MKSISICLLVAVFAFSANGWNDGWNQLRVTYNDDKTAKGAFDKLPFTRADAEKAGWEQIGDKTAGCSGVGYRYMLNKDPAVVLIYAEDGVVIGLQNGVPESALNSDKLIAWYKQQPMYQVVHPEYNKSETLYTLTVYFSDPDKICDKDFKFVHSCFYMNGTQKLSVPFKESELDPAWVKGKCNPGKGLHYYYGISKDMNCNNWQPFFPLYEDGKLVAMSFASFGEYELISTRYSISEYHPNEQYKMFFDVVPDCLYTFGNNLTSMHVYMTENPWDINCSPK